MTVGTIGTPISPGTGTGVSLAAALPATWLTLNRYLRIMRVTSPAHFYGAYNTDVFPINGTCDVVVPRHTWQMPNVASREEILVEILQAEKEIAEFMGFKLAPTFIEKELHQYPKPYEVLAVGSYGYNVKNMEISLPAGGGYALQGGVRSVTLVGTATNPAGGLEYTDEDSDGVAETAVVTVATSVTDICQLKVYVSGFGGQREWEIRGPRRKYLSGGNAVFEFDIWQFINPDLDARYPTQEQYRALDFADTTNLLASVDIYQETVDNTQPSVRFFWEEKSGGDSGSLVYQDGVLVVRDFAAGEVVPRPATYDSVNGVWAYTNWVVGKDPDQVRISYYAGSVSQEFLNGYSCDPLSDMYARAIAHMATARLTRSICGCEGVVEYFDDMRKDLALIGSNQSYNITVKDLDNPFGTRLGEVIAWKIVGKVSRDKKVEVALI